MMSVLQEVEGLTEELHFIILPGGRPVSMQNFSLNVYTARFTSCIDVFQEVKGLTYAYALDRKKTCSHAKLQVYGLS